MELTADELWSRVLESSRSGISEGAFLAWLANTEAVALSEDRLLIEVPGQFQVDWIEDKYLTMLEKLVERTLGRPLNLVFRSTLRDESPPVPVLEVTPPTPGAESGRAGTPAAAAARRAGIPGPGLNERYTFDRFVVGSNNQLAAAASHAVAQKPARMYNPLFLYGGVGLGKTHLIHAIGHGILTDDRDRTVAYVPTEQFTNELITAIQEGTTADFRRRYRRIDLLLVDDIHFLEGKERTQEEFFHTFNALYDAQKQIVLTSDRPPKELRELEQRLVSRFEWGLVADIKPPDYETRVAILRKKAADDDLTLDEDIIDFIAHSCTSSVRELEGAVIKLLALSSLRHEEITVELARTALESVMDPDRVGASRLTPERIREAAAREWGVKVEALSSKRRTKDLTVPRQVAMYLIKDILDLPLVRIGELFGGRDHSTVIHSINKVEAGLEEDPEYRRRVERLRSELGGHP